MQVVASAFPVLNRRHPDAQGLVCAHPLSVMRNGGSKEATGRDGLLWAFSGSLALTSWITYPRGRGYINDGTLNKQFLSPTSKQQVTTGTSSVIAQFRLDDAASNFQVMSNISGFAFGFNAGKLAVWSSVGSQLAVTTAMTAAAGVSGTCGVRIIGTAFRFFLNGRFEDIVGTAPTYSAAAGYLGGGVGGSGGYNGVTSDYRLYARPVADSVFLRAWAQPMGIYHRRARYFKGATAFNGGRMIPFLHPYLTS